MSFTCCSNRPDENHFALTEQLGDRLSAVDNLERPADRTHVFLGGIDFKRRADRAEQIRNVHGIINDPHSVFGRFADHLAPLNSATSEQCIEIARPVIATGIRIDFWRPSKFARPHDQRLVEKTAIFEISNQCRQRRIAFAGESLNTIKHLFMRVPAPQPDFHKRDARFNEPPSEQAAFAKF